MRIIQLNKGKTLELPECWDELTRPQIIYAFELLLRLFANEITPFQFRLLLLIKITGYKPSKLSISDKIFRRIWLSKDKYNELMALKSEIKENIHFNLIQLAELLDFAFSVEENKIIPKFSFKSNPFEYLSDTPPYFNIGYTVETNLTARQFADGLDLVVAMDQTDDADAHRAWTDRLIQVLYSDNIQVNKLSTAIKFGILCWFKSVAMFFKNHAIYSVLYRKSETEESEDKISLGLMEVILFLKKTGYSDTDSMNLIDFFNAQIKQLKDTIAQALASGIKEDELSQKIGLDPYVIYKLS
ncbi:MAG TPA: hypothetical protein PK978_06885 [Paludibacter sp.]|nr:hypothetical protein [Paludibacter sp.]HPM11051.1 hypothetical protein [Paludibacter sp.]